MEEEQTAADLQQDVEDDAGDVDINPHPVTRVVTAMERIAYLLSYMMSLLQITYPKVSFH